MRALLMLLLISGLRASAHDILNVFGNDDREAVTSTSYPWSAIGKVGSGCTGTLIDAALVVTAAHCVVDSRTKQLKYGPIYFYPNYISGRFSHRAFATAIWVGTYDPDAERSKDWAILKLSSELGRIYGWLDVANISLNEFPSQVTVVGYSSNYRGGKTAGVHKDCELKKLVEDKGLAYNDCDFGRGASGGPVLHDINGVPTIVGLVVAEKRNGGDVSLWLEEYTDDNANIAIASGMFVPTFEQIP